MPDFPPRSWTVACTVCGGELLGLDREHAAQFDTAEEARACARGLGWRTAVDAAVCPEQDAEHLAAMDRLMPPPVGRGQLRLPRGRKAGR